MEADEVRDWLQEGDTHSSAGVEESPDAETDTRALEEESAGIAALSGSAAVDLVIALAEKYFDRVNAAQMLEIIPENTPVASLLRYFSIVLEYGAAEKRNMQVRTLLL